MLDTDASVCAFGAVLSIRNVELEPDPSKLVWVQWLKTGKKCKTNLSRKNSGQNIEV